MLPRFGARIHTWERILKITTIIAGFLLALAPTLAGAVTIIGGNIVEGQTLVGAGPVFPSTTPVSVAFTNNDTKALKIFATASGSGNTKADLEQIEFGLSPDLDDTTVSNVFTSFSINGGVASGSGSAGVLAQVNPGVTFYLVFEDAGLLPCCGVATTYSVTATAVPLPAAGWMLVSAVAGLGLLGRRKTA